MERELAELFAFEETARDDAQKAEAALGVEMLKLVMSGDDARVREALAKLLEQRSGGVDSWGTGTCYMKDLVYAGCREMCRRVLDPIDEQARKDWVKRMKGGK